MEDKDYSKNERAGELCGFNPTGANPIDFPCELDYWCPVCRIDFDEGLDWSEYRSFIWCPKCNFDYPSAICKKNPKDGTKIYLDCIEELVNEAAPNKK